MKEFIIHCLEVANLMEYLVVVVNLKADLEVEVLKAFILEVIINLMKLKIN